MKPGIYRMTIDIEISDCKDKDEAVESVMTMFGEMIDSNLVPEVEFDLLEEFELDYILEDEIQELEF